jgi:Ca2+/Na+ antiporter
MDGIYNILFLEKVIKYFESKSQNKKSLYMFLFVILVLFCHYVSFYFKTNYLLTIIIFCLLLNIFLFNYINIGNNNTYKTKDEINDNGKDKVYSYLVNNVKVNNLYLKLRILEKIDKERFDKSKQYMNDFYYLLNKSQYNYNNIVSSLKMKRDEAINILKSIYLSETKFIKKDSEDKINKRIQKIYELTNFNLASLCLKKPKLLNRNFTKVDDINAPDENNLMSIDFCKHYSIY